MAPLAPVPANRRGDDGHLGQQDNGPRRYSGNGYGGGSGLTPLPDPRGPSPLRQGAVAQHEAWYDQQHAASYPGNPYTPAHYLSPLSGPVSGPVSRQMGAQMGAFGAPTPYTVPLAPDERQQLLVLREFYEIVTGPEKDGERARRLRAIAGAVGLPLAGNPLTASQAHLDSDAAAHRWLRWVRYCRQEAGDVAPFFHLVHGALYGDAFWAAREEGERLCARALSVLYERDGAPGQRPDPRRRPLPYSDRTLLQTAATLSGVRWAMASPELQQQTNATLARLRTVPQYTGQQASQHTGGQHPNGHTGAMRPPLVALLITPGLPTGPGRAVPGGAFSGSGPGSPGSPGSGPLVGPCCIIRTADPQYAAEVNWDFACMLGYLTLLRPFFVGTGHPGDYRELPSPRADTSITPHLHQFALALTSEEGCPLDLGCECRRVAWSLNLPPPQHLQATGALDVQAVRDYEAAQGITRPPLRSVPLAHTPPAPSALAPFPPPPPPPPIPLPTGLPFHQWPAEDGAAYCGGRDGEDGDETAWGAGAFEGLPPAPTSDGSTRPALAPVPPSMPSTTSTPSTPPYQPRTVMDVWRAQADAQAAGHAAEAQAARDALAHGAPLGQVNAADLVDPDLLDTGEAPIPALEAAMGAEGPLTALPSDERRYETPVLPVRRPHRNRDRGGKGKPQV